MENIYNEKYKINTFFNKNIFDEDLKTKNPRGL
jgi:hypothetical protein